ncbi:MAG TPA: hypothetical protein PLW93_02520 [Candidatus Absconditabacterales bacterium]|nr:hypothetical protein [Candidatus Absconditabacterales bacterium]
MKRSFTISIISVLLIIISLLGWSQFGYSQEYRNDCNLLLTKTIPTNLGFFTKEDIESAYANMQTNCPPNKSDNQVPSSQYMYDHLLWIGFKKLAGTAESLGLKSDPAGLELRAMREEITEGSAKDSITELPATYQERYHKLRQATGTYSIILAQEGYYTGSTGLYTKYQALCDIIRGMMFNPLIVQGKQGYTSAILDQKTNECIHNYIPQHINIIANTQQSATTINAHIIKTKIQEAINSDSQEQLNDIIKTTEQAKNDTAAVTKKIDQKMDQCNITDN